MSTGVVTSSKLTTGYDPVLCPRGQIDSKVSSPGAAPQKCPTKVFLLAAIRSNRGSSANLHNFNTLGETSRWVSDPKTSTTPGAYITLVGVLPPALPVHAPDPHPLRQGARLFAVCGGTPAQVRRRAGPSPPHHPRASCALIMDQAECSCALRSGPSSCFDSQGRNTAPRSPLAERQDTTRYSPDPSVPGHLSPQPIHQTRRTRDHLARSAAWRARAGEMARRIHRDASPLAPGTKWRPRPHAHLSVLLLMVPC